MTFFCTIFVAVTMCFVRALRCIEFHYFSLLDEFAESSVVRLIEQNISEDVKRLTSFP